MAKHKRLFFDAEVSPNVGLFWRTGYNLTILPENIIKERAIICVAYKWEDSPLTYNLTWDDGDDKQLLIDFVAVANKADEIIAHNGDKFDIKWLRTRCAYHRLPMFPKYVTVDTLKLARSQFYFNSNKLDYIAKFLGLDGKGKAGYDLWRNLAIDNTDKVSLRAMVRYCKQDVLVLESVFRTLKPLMPHKTHRAVFEGGKLWECVECGSSNTIISKTRVSAAGIKRVQLQCRDCYKYFTVSRTTAEKHDEEIEGREKGSTSK